MEWLAEISPSSCSILSRTRSEIFKKEGKGLELNEIILLRKDVPMISHTLARTRIPSYAIEIKGNTFISSEMRFVHARAISLPFKKNTTGSLPFLTPLKSTSHAMRSPRYAIASEKEDFFDCESKVACDASQYWMAPVECQLPIWVVDQLICMVPTPWPDRRETREICTR